MTSDLFFSCLQRFNAYISATRDKKAILFLFNCSDHGIVSKLPYFSNVKVLFLPSNKTTKLQLLDAGIIAAMKLYYQSFQMKRSLDLLDKNFRILYKMDIIISMKTF